MGARGSPSPSLTPMNAPLASPRSIANRPVGELVAQDYRYAEVFKRHGIDFCCGGGRTVETACSKKGISPDVIESEFEELAQRHAGDVEDLASNLRAEKLADYIERVHHGYVRANIPLLLELTRKVARVHGHAQTELPQIQEIFEQMASDLEKHMGREEQVLFPFIRKLAGVSDGASGVFGGAVEGPIRMMEAEHEEAGTAMKAIRALSNDFTPPDHACNSYVVAYRKLEEFETDLHRHVHLENNVLFPEARRLQEQARVQSNRCEL